MSCRVLKRDMEIAMLDRLVERAREKGIKTIRGHYYPTAKNNMVRNLFGTFGFTKVSEDETGNTEWFMETSSYEKKNNYIDVKLNNV